MDEEDAHRSGAIGITMSGEKGAAAAAGPTLPLVGRVDRAKRERGGVRRTHRPSVPEPSRGASRCQGIFSLFGAARQWHFTPYGVICHNRSA